MSLHPREIPPIPEETMSVARAAFPRGNVYTHMRDELGAIYNDQLTLCPLISNPWAAGGVALAPGLNNGDAICRRPIRSPGRRRRAQPH